MKYIFANWKMYLDFDESVQLAKELYKTIDTVSADMQLGIFPSTLALKQVSELSEGSVFKIGSQDAGFPPKGAYTGLVSAQMVADIGCTYALVGHSERRHIFHETNEDIRKKLEGCIEAKITPVLCIGETQEDRDVDKAQYRLKKQLLKAFEGMTFNSVQPIVAYEPVWAIGSGQPCLPQDAADVIGWIKKEIQELTGATLPVLYGGSVSQDNVVSYVMHEMIDGVLIGGASTKHDSFVSIISSLTEHIV